ncbi:MAG: hypothetical protein JXB32_13395 [Deltaproteobacteria bacterium]|nr:hypothetical protein [Deltaproteobacteria bacterium]
MIAERLRAWALGTSAVGCIALQFGGSLAWSSVALALWLLALGLFHRHLLRRLWLPRFWLAGLVVVAASALLFEPRDLEWAGVAVSSRGLEAGALMIVRGTFIFGLALVASRGLAGEGWVRWCRRLRAERVGTSVRAAFEVLPALQQEFRDARAAAGADPACRSRLGRGRETAVRFVVRVARLADRLAREEPEPDAGPR